MKFVFCLSAILLNLPVLIAQDTNLVYPETKTVKQVDDFHGTEVDDPYLTQNNLLQTQSVDTAYDPTHSHTTRPTLRVGSFVEAEITGKVLDQVVRIPLNVLQTDGTVWLINDAGAIYEQAVTVLTSDQNFVYVSEGLRDNDRIAMGYVDVTIPGTRVEIAKLIQLPSGSPVAAQTGHSETTPATLPAPDNSSDATPVVAPSTTPLVDNAPSQGI